MVTVLSDKTSGSRRTRRDGRMLDPRTGRPLQCLAVADVDLDTGTATMLEPLTAPEGLPQGVHALVWFHGRPIGEVTALGPLDEVRRDLVQLARAKLADTCQLHLLHDALSTPGGLARARSEGLEALSHPDDNQLPAEPTPSLSIAVCTRDRPDNLRSCLEALRALRDPVHEIVVIDNASSDERSRHVVAEFEGIRYVREPRRGLDWARNRALLEASGDLLAYVDDDVAVHPAWVGGLLRAFLEEPAAVAVTGLVVPRELSTPAQVLFEALGGFGRGYRRKWFSVAVHEGAVAAKSFGASGVAGTGANMAFRRQAALDLGGFDTALGVGTVTSGGDDLEMLFRVVATGGLIVYEPSAVVRHAHRSDLPGLLRQMRGNGTGAYSYFLGAGRCYGGMERRQFPRLAARSFVQHEVGGYLDAVRRPRRLPLRMRLAQTRGAFDAVTRSYYRRAQRQAAQELSDHQGPVPPDLVRSAVPATGGAAPSTIGVELCGQQAVQVSAADATSRSAWCEVRLTCEGQLRRTITCFTGGSPLSSARLRWELVDQVGVSMLDGVAAGGSAAAGTGPAQSR